MESPYTAAFFIQWLLSFAQPLPEFISWLIWFGFLRLVEWYASPARQYDLLACGLALSLGTGAVGWTSIAVEAACLNFAWLLPLPFGLISGATVTRLTVANYKEGIVNYFTFRETDERNLGEMANKSAGVTAFVLVTATSMLYRILSTYWDCIVVSSAAVIVAMAVPRVRQLVPADAARSAAWFVTRWTIKTYFYTTDKSTSMAHACMRSVENWESSVSKDRVAALELYAYTPLDPCKREIRLLRVRRRTFRPEIVCDFIHVAVDEAPSFDSISYTWGGEALTDNIVVDGRRIAVTPTVSRWLRYRRSFFSEAHLWVDALCIDQMNRDEKASQIPLMGSIYTAADRTVVWLAHPADVSDSYAARSLLMTLAMLRRQGATTAQLQYVVSRDASMGALIRLLAVPYFHRIWVIQEIALARRVHICYGNVTMNWDALAFAALALSDSRLVGSMSRNANVVARDAITVANMHLINIAGISAIRQGHQEGQRLSFLDVLAETYKSTATIPHDNILGVLGLIDDLPPDIVRPDYGEPVERFFARIARYAIARDSDFSLLQAAGSGYPASKRLTGLPSWVPDFTRDFDRRRKVRHSVSGLRMRNSGDKDIDYRVLTTDICAFDTIATLQTESCIMFEQHKPVWEIHADGLHDKRSEDPDSTSPSTQDQIKSFLTWHDDAIAVARANPVTVEMYPDDIDYEVISTMCTNSPEVLEDDASTGITGIARYRMCIAVMRVTLLVYETYPDEDGATMDARIKELCQTSQENWDAVVTPELNHFFFHIGATAGGKSFCVTETGRMAMVPPGSRAGDLVAYIRGQAIPFVLRPVGQESYFELLGGCYVHGVSDIGGQVEQEWSEASIV